MTNETTKPVVTQAALLPCPFCGGDELSHGYSDTGGNCECHNCDAGIWADTEAEAITAWNTRLASQAVVSQDLVPVAWMYEQPSKRLPDRTDTRLSGFIWPDWARHNWTETALYPASAIEAAQIAARNEALEEAAGVFDHAIGSGYPTPKNKADTCPHDKFGWEDCIACYDEFLINRIKAIRSLRTPSQHQEEQ